MQNKITAVDYLIPEGTWVKVRDTHDARLIRYVTKHMNSECFMDDGIVSGQAPSPRCYYDRYEPLFKTFK